MLKSVKISEEAYRVVKKLARLMESEKILKGVHKVTLSLAISYAATVMLEDMERQRRRIAALKRTAAKL